MNFGIWLENHLEKNRLTKTWLAAQAGISHSVINYYKRDTCPSLKTAHRIISVICSETQDAPEKLWIEVFMMLEER